MLYIIRLNFICFIAFHCCCIVAIKDRFFVFFLCLLFLQLQNVKVACSMTVFLSPPHGDIDLRSLATSSKKFAQ